MWTHAQSRCCASCTNTSSRPVPACTLFGARPAGWAGGGGDMPGYDHLPRRLHRRLPQVSVTLVWKAAAVAAWPLGAWQNAAVAAWPLGSSPQRLLYGLYRFAPRACALCCATPHVELSLTRLHLRCAFFPFPQHVHHPVLRQDLPLAGARPGGLHRNHAQRDAPAAHPNCGLHTGAAGEAACLLVLPGLFAPAARPNCGVHTVAASEAAGS